MATASLRVNQLMLIRNQSYKQGHHNGNYNEHWTVDDEELLNRQYQDLKKWIWDNDDTVPGRSTNDGNRRLLQEAQAETAAPHPGQRIGQS